MLCRPPTPTLFPYTTLFRSTRQQFADRIRMVLAETRRKAIGAGLRVLTRKSGGIKLAYKPVGRFRKSECQFYPDRKSTRLNSSHRCISYAVFCLKKKKNQ